MSAHDDGDPRWRWAFRACVVASVVPLWCVQFAPFSDMPEQIAVIATLRHWWDPAWRLQEHYALALGKSQYLLYHVVGALLSLVVGSAELSNRLLMTAVGVAYPYALRALLGAVERDRRLAVFGIAAFWSRPLVMGFLPYVASVPVVAWGLALAVTQARAPTRGRGVALAAIALALFYLHANAFVLFLVAATAVTFEADRRSAARTEDTSHLAAARIALRALPGRVAWLAPSLAVAAVWSVFGSLGSGGAALHAGNEVGYIPNAELVRELPQWAHDIWMSHVDEWCTVALWVAFAALAIQRGDGGRPDERDGARVARTHGGHDAPAIQGGDVAWVPFACAIATYFVLPYRVAAGVMLNVRVAVFVVLFAPLLIRRIRGIGATVPLAAIFVSVWVTAGNAAFELRAAERDELGDIDRLVDRIPVGARVVTLTFHVTSNHVHWAPYTFMGAYHRARAGGVSSYSFSHLAHWPIHFRPEAAPPPKPVFWTFNSCGYRNATDGAYFDYVLARGNVDPFRDAPPGARWRKLDATRDWTLFEKIQGETNPPWTVPDDGPCESRRTLERAATTTTTTP